VQGMEDGKLIIEDALSTKMGEISGSPGKR
jgi:hypothetical protein